MKVNVNTGTCIWCSKEGFLEVPQEVLDKWDWGRGEFIQVAWPDGSADEREQLMTGTHGKCYSAMMKDFG